MPSTASVGSQQKIYGTAALGWSSNSCCWNDPPNPLTVTAIAPPAPTSVTVGTISPNSIAISWSGSTSGFYARYKAGTTPPTSVTDGTLLYDGSGTSATATGLTPLTTYSFAVWGKVTFGTATTYSTNSVSVSATTLAPPPGQQFASIATWGTRQSPTSQGKVMFVDTNGAVALYDGTTTTVVEAQGAQSAVDPIVFNLGSSSSPGQVIGAWRRGTDAGHVWVEGGTVRLVTATNPINAAQAMNAEAVSVADGCVFMVLQAFDANANTVKHVFKVDPATGAGGSSLSGTADVPGVFRISSSQCKAAWAYWDTANTNSIQYYNGSSVSTIDPNANATSVEIRNGKIVYAKPVGGVSQIFLYDTTAVSPAPVQLTSYTGPSKVAAEPQTDGRHISWVLKNADGSNPNIILYDGFQLTNNDMVAISNDHAYHMNRGEVIWKDSAGNLQYLSPGGFSVYNVPSASSYDKPWLSDGDIAYLLNTGTNTTGYRIVGTAPADGPPPPPMVLKATYGNGEVALSWDTVLGATSYNIYYAAQSGVTKTNYTTLPGGTKITGATSPRTITGLTNGTTYFFVVTTVDATGESPNSMEASARAFPTWLPGNAPAVGFIGLGTDKTNGNLALAGGGKGSGARNTDIYRTVNAGHIWSAVGGGGSGKDAKAFAIDGTKAYAATTDGGILRSTDSGATWTTALNASGYGEQIASIALDPTNTNTMYAGDYVTPPNTGEPLVVKSTDGGTNWSALPSGSIHAYVLQTDPATTGIVYAAGTGTPNIAKSTDSGATWNDVGPRFGAVYAMAIDPLQPSTVYAGLTDTGVFPYANLGIYKSTDGGTTWIQKNNGLPSTLPRINYLLADPAVANEVHLATDAGYFISNDGGASWNAANSGLPSLNVTSLAITPSRKLLATAGNGIYILNLSTGVSITTLSPLSVSTGGGSTITIRGNNFKSGATVTVGGIAATNVNVLSSNMMTATVPAHSAGLVDVIVTNPDAQSATLPASLTYVPPPVISSVVPSSGPTTGGTSIVISGSGFQTGASVTIGGLAATGASVVSASTITATTPAHAAGAADVVVTNPDG